MPIPILIVIAVISALAGGTALAVNWDAIVINWKGKRLAILGARGVGKTYLHKFLTTGSIPAEYKQGTAPEKTPPRRFQLHDLNLNIKDGLDVPGDTNYRDWKEQHDLADIVFYLLRADRLIAGDATVESRVLADIKQIAGWRKNNPPRLFIIGTHCDLDSEFATLDPNKKGDYKDKFRRLPIVNELELRAGGAQQPIVVLGSMKTDQDTEALVYEIFKQVAS